MGREWKFSPMGTNTKEIMLEESHMDLGNIIGTMEAFLKGIFYKGRDKEQVYGKEGLVV